MAERCRRRIAFDTGQLKYNDFCTRIVAILWQCYNAGLQKVSFNSRSGRGAIPLYLEIDFVDDKMIFIKKALKIRLKFLLCLISVN